MELRGTLKSWNDQKGFGFIRPEQPGDAVFVHISVVRGDRRPAPGDRVLYVAGRDGQGRPRAEHVRLDAPVTLDRPEIRQRPLHARSVERSPADPSARRPSPPCQWLALKLALFVALLILPLWGCLAAWQAQRSVVLPVAYGSASLIAFLLYWKDKRSALRGEWRTPESTLHLAELLCGWPGALVAQQAFRHKTRKPGFQGVCWVIVLAHQVFWIDRLFLNRVWSDRVLGVLLELVFRLT